MAYPSSGTLRARPDIASSLMAFDLAANAGQFVGQQVFPVTEVPVFTGKFGKVDAKELLQNPNPGAEPGFGTQRAPRAGYLKGDMKFTEESWTTREFGVDENESKAYASYFDHEVVAASRAQAVVLTEFEKRVAAKVFDLVTFTTGNNGRVDVPSGDRLDEANWETGSFLKYVEQAIVKVYDKSGIWPDSVVMNRKAFRNLRQIKQVRDRIHASGAGDPERAGLITVQQIAQILDLPNVYVAGGTENTANRNATFAPAQIWGKHMMIFKRANSGDLREPCLGRTFHWAEDASMPTGYTESYFSEELRSNVVRVRHQTDEKLLLAEVGCMLGNVLS
jgi:hypothetical protein